jgi:hypothetical protein
MSPQIPDSTELDGLYLELKRIDEHCRGRALTHPKHKDTRMAEGIVTTTANISYTSQIPNAERRLPINRPLLIRPR